MNREEDDALLGVWPALPNGWEGRLGHVLEPEPQQCGVDSCMKSFGDLLDDVGESMML